MTARPASFGRRDLFRLGVGLVVATGAAGCANNGSSSDGGTLIGPNSPKVAGLVPTTLVAALLGDAVLDFESPRSIAALTAWLVLGAVGAWWGRILLRRAGGTA